MCGIPEDKRTIGGKRDLLTLAPSLQGAGQKGDKAKKDFGW